MELIILLAVMFGGFALWYGVPHAYWLGGVSLVLVVVLICLSGIILAAETAPPTGPCVRGPTQIKMGGIDLDIARCQIALDAQRMGEMQSELNATRATLALVQADAAAQAKEMEGWKEYAKPLYEHQNK